MIGWAPRHTAYHYIRLAQDIVRNLLNVDLWNELIHLRTKNDMKNFSPTLRGSKMKSQNTLYPVLDPNSGYSCTLMLFTNLAQPEWISIKCKEKLLFDIMCVIDKQRNTTLKSNIDVHSLLHSCPQSAVVFDKTCYSFIWHDQSLASLEDTCKKVKMKTFNFNNISALSFITIAISRPIPPIFNSNNSTWLYQKYFSSQYTQSKGDLVGLATCFGKETLYDYVGLNVFRCKSTTFFSTNSVCDGQVQCPNNDAAEEQNCPVQNSTGMKKSCSPLLFMSHRGTCHKFILMPSKPVNDNDETQSLIQASEPRSKTSRPEASALIVNQVQQRMCPMGEMSCGKWAFQCFKVTDICIYRLSGTKEVLPCHNGAHMDNCLSFQCNIMFKCPEFYCIPWGYVCDGMWDCPFGADEIFSGICTAFPMCSNMFKCVFRKTQCIHLGDVCDGKADCPNGDDEFLCQLMSLKCIPACECLALAIHCGSKTQVPLFNSIFYPFVSLSVVSVKTIEVHNILTKFQNLLFLAINKANVTFFKSIIQLQNIVLLDLESNYLTKLTKSSFLNLTQIRTLLLGNNKIDTLEDKCLGDLDSLFQLDLSNNLFTSLPNALLEVNVNLKILLLRHTQLTDYSIRLNHITFSVIVATDFHFCCGVPPYTICTAACRKLWYVSCSGLLPNDAAKIVLLSLLSSLILINSGVVVSLKIDRTFQKAYKATLGFIIALFVSQVFYFASIWGSDLFYSEMYALKQELWRSSVLCLLLFGYSLWYSLSLPICFSLLSVSRWRVVASPIKTNFKRTSYCVKHLLINCLTNFLLCCTCTFLQKYFSGEVPTSLCFPFSDPTHSIILVKVVTFLAASVHLMCSIVSTIWHVALVREYRKSRVVMEASSANQQVNRNNTSDKPLIIQLSLISVSCFFGFVPYMFYIVLLFLPTFPMELLVWAVLTGAPSHSLLSCFILLVFTVK